MKELLQKTKEKFQTHPEDKRWPCPFCLNKEKTRIQCNIHIKKDYPNLYRGNEQDILSQFDDTLRQNDSSIFEGNINSNNKSQFDLRQFLKSINETNYEQDRSTEYMTCRRYTDKPKKCKGLKGLKVHYSKAHKEFMSDFQSNELSNGSERKYPEEMSQGNQLLFKCRVEECEKSFNS